MYRHVSSNRRAAKVAAILFAAASPALAADKSWLVANGVWGTAGNWNPLGAPTPADNAFIGNTAGAENGMVSLGGNANAFNLSISDGMTLRTQLFTPTILAHTFITGFNDPAGPDLFRSRLMVDNGNNAIDFQTNSLTVEDGGHVSLSSGATMRVNALFDLDSSSTLTGNGNVELFSNAAGPAMIVNGGITPNSGGFLQLIQNGTGRVDLDGSLEGDQTINVTGTTGFTYSAFKVDGTGLYDAFGDRFLIGRGNVVNMSVSEGWTLSQAGEVHFQHDAARTDLAGMYGDHTTINGTVSVDANGAGIWQAWATINPSAHITVGQGGSMTFNQITTINGGEFDIANFASLYFNSPILVNGGTFNAAGPTGDVNFIGTTAWSGETYFSGIARVVGNASASAAATTINADTLDMDGPAGGTIWTVNAPMTINADEIEFSNGPFDGVISVNSPNVASPNYLEMNVQSPGGWAMNGTMSVNGPGGGIVTVNTLRGSDLTVGGVVNVSGGNTSTARLNVSGGTVNMAANSGLRLNGGTIANPNTITGGRILGAGTLRASANHALVGSGTIGATIDFDGNSELLANNGFLRITGSIADVGVIGTAGATGNLNVTNPWNTGVAERVELLGGFVSGGEITNDGHITGHGAVIAQGIINNGSISAVGGELEINASGAGAIDLDGTSGTAQIFAMDGNLTIVDEPSDNFDGDVFVGPGRTITFQNGWHTTNQANVSLTGTPGNPAVIAGDGQSFFGSDITISGPVRFEPSTLISSGTDIQTSAAGDSLTVRNTLIDAGVSITGPGELRVLSTGTLQLADGANVGVKLVNPGLVFFDYTNQTGIASAQRYEQTATGSMQVEIAGTVPGNDFDRFNVAQDAQIAGKLDLSILGGYVPEYLQPHEIIRADSVTGIFDTVPSNMITPTKYWAVTYDADSVTATAALPGDANLDGTVDISDFAILASQFNTAGPWAEGNFNGDARADIGDFALLGANFNVSVASLPRAFSGTGSAVPEPTAMMSAIVAIAGLGLRSRRRRV